ncbi:MAG: CPBP family intramembrane metalloprotease [Candidatus Bostrichicola ureolyticus]|nr:MAG: CPBP family intramembrane metalloprotease [Candidatus Bostrichicola ureolyticus]
MNKKFNLNYIKSIYLIINWLFISIITICISTILIKKFFVPIYILFPISYVIPFILIFYFLSLKYNFNKKVIKDNLKLSKWYFYPLIFIILLLTMILTEYILYLIQIRSSDIIKYFCNPISFIITTIILAPICEEILFRGIILNGLIKNKIYYINAILFSSFLFGIIHMNPLQFIAGFIIGSVIGFIYFSTRSILNCIFLHLFNNLIETLLYYNNKNIKDNIIYKIQNYKFIIFIIIIVLIFCLYLLFINTKNIWKTWNNNK